MMRGSKKTGRKNVKRGVSLALCMVLLATLAPESIMAAEDPVTVSGNVLEAEDRADSPVSISGDGLCDEADPEEGIAEGELTGEAVIGSLYYNGQRFDLPQNKDIIPTNVYVAGGSLNSSKEAVYCYLDNVTDTHFSGIECKSDLVIVIEGENTLYMTGDYDRSDVTYGIHAHGKLTFVCTGEGESSLTIITPDAKVKSDGIFATELVFGGPSETKRGFHNVNRVGKEGEDWFDLTTGGDPDVTVYSGRVQKGGSTYGADCSKASITCGSLCVEGRGVPEDSSAEGDSKGMWARGSLVMNGGSLTCRAGTANTKSVGLDTQILEMSAGRIDARAGNTRGTNAYESFSRGVNVKTLTAGGYSSLRAEGGTSVYYADANGNYENAGLYVEKELTLSDGARVTGVGGQIAEGIGSAWGVNKGVYGYSIGTFIKENEQNDENRITLGGSSVLEGRGGTVEGNRNGQGAKSGSYGVYFHDEFEITGSGTLKGTGGTVIFPKTSDGSVSPSCGIYSEGTLTVTDTHINAKGGDVATAKTSQAIDGESYGIYSDDGGGFEDAKVTATGGDVRMFNENLPSKSHKSFGAYFRSFCNIGQESGAEVTATAGSAQQACGLYCHDALLAGSRYDAVLTADAPVYVNKGKEPEGGFYACGLKLDNPLNVQYGILTAKGLTKAIDSRKSIGGKNIEGGMSYDGSDAAFADEYDPAWRYAVLDACRLRVNISDWTYGEVPVEPVYDTTLFPNLEPEITYSGTTHDGKAYSGSEPPTEAGSYRVTVRYPAYDNGSASFRILPADLSDTAKAGVVLGTQDTYDGFSHRAVISSVTCRNDRENTTKTLTEGVDYEITGGKTATDAGETVLEITGRGNYKGTVRKPWSLKKADLTANMFLYCGDQDRTFNDSSFHLPSPRLKSPLSGCGSIALYYEGINGTVCERTMDSRKDPGQYAVTFDVNEGKNFNAKRGLAYGTLTIAQSPNNPVEVVPSVVVGRSSVTDLNQCVKGYAGSPSFGITGNARGCVVDPATGSFSAGDATGDVTVTVTFPGDSYYLECTKNIIVTVSSKTGKSLTVDVSDVTYPAAVANPVVSGYSGDLNITYSGTERDAGAYGPTATKPVNAGNYTVSVTAEDSGNIYTGTADFRILPADISKASIYLNTSNPDYPVYEGGKKYINGRIDTYVWVTVGDTRLSELDPEDISKNKDYIPLDGFGAADCSENTLILQGFRNYTGTLSVPWSLKKAAPVPSCFKDASKTVTYNGKAWTVTPETAEEITGMGEVTVYYGDSAAPPSDAGEYDIMLSVEEGQNFTSTSGRIKVGTLTIEKANHPAIPTIEAGGQPGVTTYLEFEDYIEKGGHIKNISDITGETNLSGGEVQNEGSVLRFRFKETAGVGSSASCRVNIWGCKNYKDYSIIVSLTADHEHVLEKVEARECCTEHGNREYYVCTGEGCNRMFLDAEGTILATPKMVETEPAGHDWGEWTVISDPTDTEPGVKIRECTRCHAVETDDSELCTVRFDLNGHGSGTIASQNVDKRNRITEPDTIPTDPDYAFGSWCIDPEGTVSFDFSEPVMKSMTLYAKWVRKCNVSFDLNGKAGSAPASQKVDPGKTIHKPADPVCEGFRFMGWFEDSAMEYYFDPGSPVEHDMTLYAGWVSDTSSVFTVSFDLNGKTGEPPLSQLVEEGHTASRPAEPSYAGSYFRGWYNEPECHNAYDFGTPVSGNTVLYARWEDVTLPAPFRIFFDPEGLKADPYTGLTYNTLNGHYEWVYGGTKLAPAIRVTDYAGSLLTEGVDYTVKYTGNKNVSAKPAKVIVTGKGSYSGKKYLEFYILKADIARAKKEKLLVMPETLYAVKGKSLSPAVYYRGTALGKKAIKINAPKKITADTTVSIEGKGSNFTGKISNIPVRVLSGNEAAVKSIKVSLTADKHVYNGTPQELSSKELTVRAGSAVLNKDTDYKVIYYNNTNAGTAGVLILGTGEYLGAVKKTFRILPDKKSQVTADAYEMLTYDPSGLYPGLVVKAGGRPLRRNKDYTLKVSKKRNKNYASFTLSFKGNYKGHKQLKKTIAVGPAEFKTARIDVADLIYKKPGKYLSTAYVSIDGRRLDKKDYTVRYFDGENEIGPKTVIRFGSEKKKTITVKAVGKGNYKPEEAEGTFTYDILAAPKDKPDLRKAKIVDKTTGRAVAKQKYTGDLIAPEIEVLYKKGSSWEKADPGWYDVTYINNRKKGKAVILVTGNGTDAFGSKTAAFAIIQRSLFFFEIW